MLGMERPNELVIEVRGGMITGIYSIDEETPITVKVLDWDLVDEPRPVQVLEIVCISESEYKEMETLFTKTDIEEEVS